MCVVYKKKLLIRWEESKQLVENFEGKLIISNYGLGYDGENGGLLRLRGKVIEKKGLLWFSYKDS